MLDGALLFAVGVEAGCAWTWFLIRSERATFAAERAQYHKERDALVQTLGQYVERVEELESMAGVTGIPPEEM